MFLVLSGLQLIEYVLYLEQPTYWGLSNDVDGCKPCDCDVGGAYDNNCDQSTGECKCRPNIIGRRCDQPAPGYFVTNLDYLMYEGEFAHGSRVRLDWKSGRSQMSAVCEHEMTHCADICYMLQNTRMVIREPQPGRPHHLDWTWIYESTGGRYIGIYH